MRILVLATAARFGGALTVLQSLHTFAVRNATVHDWVFLVGPGVLSPAPGVEVVVDERLQRSRYRRLALDLGLGKGAIAAHKPDVVVSLHNTMPPGLKARTVLYVQQSIPFQDEMDFSFLNSAQRGLATYQNIIGALIKNSVRKCDLVVVQSQWMRSAIQKTVRDDVTDIVVATVAVPEVHVRDRSDFDPRAFIYPTNGVVYKNDQVILDAVELIPAAHVTLTTTGPPRPGVEFAGRLPREELLRRMAAATLVFPSLFETVGLPLLEARCLGVPILAADLPYAHEALEGYSNVAYFDPRDPVALAALMRHVIQGGMAPTTPSTIAKDAGGWAHVLQAIEAL